MQFQRILWQTVFVSKGWLEMFQFVPHWCLAVFCDNAVDEQNLDGDTKNCLPDRNFLDAFN